MSSVVAFMRATRGPRACKFPVRRRFSSICSSRRATPWSRGECGLGSLRRHLTPLRRRPILELANATCALALGEQLLGLPPIEFIGALAFHWRLSISEAPLQASTSSGGLPAGNATAEYRQTSQRFSVAGRRAARRRRCRPAWSAFRIVEPPPG